MLQIETIAYQGWTNCYQMTNGHLQIIVTADVGPRIIHFGFVDGPNELIVLPEDAGRIGDTEFRFYGGHRLWHAPEVMPRTYQPDNQTARIEIRENGIQAFAPVEVTTGIQKQLTITVDDELPRMNITHRLVNHHLWAVELAPWAITMCAPGGMGIMPLPPGGEHAQNLLPHTSIALWAYTNLSDPRWLCGDQFMMLQQDPQFAIPQKAGLFAPDGWIAYANQNHLLVKTTDVETEGIYPDRGSNVELYANDVFLEIETLGPLTRLEPGQHVEHIENWYLFDNVPELTSEDAVIQHIVPLIEAVKEG